MPCVRRHFRPGWMGIQPTAMRYAHCCWWKNLNGGTVQMEGHRCGMSRPGGGAPLNRVWLRTEGSHSAGDETEAHLELFWGHATSRWWDVLLGVRQEFSGSIPRTSMAFGVQGLAPQWFETQLTALVSDEGHHALVLQMDRDLLLTNRLVLQPRLDLEARARDEPRAGLGSGLSVGRFSLRLRYEAHREFAPYLGLEWERACGDTADFRRAERRAVEETRLVLGLRMWF